MGCTKRLCTAEKIFIFINIAFAVIGMLAFISVNELALPFNVAMLPAFWALCLLMYSGALLSTAARLAWDPSTYAWFRFLCAAQYRVSAAYVAATGLWLAALVYLAAAAGGGGGGGRRPASCLHAYCAGVLCLALSELCYAAWMGASLAAWWRDSPQAELARRGIDLLHDVKPALRAMQRHQDVVAPLLDMIEEVEHEAPNNVFVIIVFGVVGMILQIAAFVMARRLLRRGGGGGSLQALSLAEKAEKGAGGAGVAGTGDADDESALTDSGAGSGDRPPGWHKKANLRMYTILDKIF